MQLQRDIPKTWGDRGLKSKRILKTCIHLGNSNSKYAIVAVVKLNYTDFKFKNSIDLVTGIKHSIHQEDVTILKIYVILPGLSGGKNLRRQSILTLGDFDIQNSIPDVSCRKIITNVIPTTKLMCFLAFILK